ncbi:hypothetical protein QWY87_17830, partial [Lutimonas halocynthiae]|uniref:hypothetical protein n=1 Tax=Lutimonas halocynthiae TaxID=1446477 RepID=UPI0025B2B366
GPPTNTDDNKGVYAYDKAKHTLYGPKATADEWGDPPIMKGLDSFHIDFQGAKLFVVPEALKINEMGAEGDYYLDTKIPKLHGPKKAPELTSVTIETLIEFSSKKDDDAIGSYSIDLNSKTMFGPKKDPSKWGESFEVNIVTKEPDVKDMTNGSYYYIQDDKKLIGPVDITLWPEL